jgi:hypothetical protein
LVGVLVVYDALILNGFLVSVGSLSASGCLVGYGSLKNCGCLAIHGLNANRWKCRRSPKRSAVFTEVRAMNLCRPLAAVDVLLGALRAMQLEL